MYQISEYVEVEPVTVDFVAPKRFPLTGLQPTFGTADSAPEHSSLTGVGSVIQMLNIDEVGLVAVL